MNILQNKNVNSLWRPNNNKYSWLVKFHVCFFDICPEEKQENVNGLTYILSNTSEWTYLLLLKAILVQLSSQRQKRKSELLSIFWSSCPKANSSLNNFLFSSKQLLNRYQ